MDKYGDLIWFLIIGMVVGWLASAIMKRSDLGLIRSMIVGIVGAMLGGTIADFLEIDLEDTFGHKQLGMLVTSFAGALIFLVLINLFKTPEKKK